MRRILDGCLVMIGILAIDAIPATAAEAGDLNHQLRPFVYGRDYFVLRSGRVQMIVQADRADLGPALTYLLFNAEDSSQNAHKNRAFNFSSQDGFASSATEVVLGKFAFTALGHTTDTRWVRDEGIPSVEAVWWAGGVRVTERICALGEANAFRRTVRLDGANLAGEDSVVLRLRLPSGSCESENGLLLAGGSGARWALIPANNLPARVVTEKGSVEIGPLNVGPGQVVTVETVLAGAIPAGDKQALVERAKDLRGEELRTAVERTRASWLRTSQVQTQDRVIQEIYDKARFGLPGMVAANGTMNASIFQYGAQWVRDTSNTALGALHAGHFELARAALQLMLTRMISKEGVTMIAGAFDSPDREQFDQMGELVHLLRNYRDWTGDDSLVREHRELLLALIERPLQAQFRDDTGMVHNRREAWERTFDDAYELFYQTYVILGLREAAELAPVLGARDRAERWLAEASRIQQATLAHPTRSLVHEGRLIKRRNVNGTIADFIPMGHGVPDSPAATERHHRLMPDATLALPIAFRLVNPQSDLARRTLDDLEQLWNARWSFGGYERYHSSSQLDQPGPWTFATAFILRGQHEARLFDRSRRSLEWLNTQAGGRTGSWVEEVPLNRHQIQHCGILPWTSGEIALFVVRHYLGVQFEQGQLVLRPALYPDSPPVSADLRFRQGRLRLEISGTGPKCKIRVNGQLLKPDKSGAFRLPKL